MLGFLSTWRRWIKWLILGSFWLDWFKITIMQKFILLKCSVNKDNYLICKQIKSRSYLHRFVNIYILAAILYSNKCITATTIKIQISNCFRFPVESFLCSQICQVGHGISWKLLLGTESNKILQKFFKSMWKNVIIKLAIDGASLVVE